MSAGEDDVERELEPCLGKVDGWMEEFERSPHFERLSGMEQDESRAVIRFFTEYSCSYLGVTPETWDRRSVVEGCVSILPRKVTAEIGYFQAVAPVLSAFFSFLAEKGCLPNGRALAETVAGLGDRIVAAAEDPRNWGMAKSLGMKALAEGVDLTNPRALDAFMVKTNLEILGRRSAPTRPASEAYTSSAGMMSAVAEPIRRSQPKVSRNDPCPCGSGRKYKKCCGA
jgi:hypothetical protein